MKRTTPSLKSLLFLLFVLSSASAYGQRADDFVIEEHMRYSAEKKFNSWSVSVGYGPLIMYTDITSYTLFPDEHWDFAPMVKISKYLNPAFAFDFQFLGGNMYGSNAGYYFEGDILDYTISHVGIINQMLATPGPRKDKWNFFYKIGFGGTAFRSKLHYSSNDSLVMERDFSGDSLDTRYVVLGYDLYNPDKKTTREHSLVLPVGIGVMYRINRSFDLGVEMTMRFSLFDKYDNILAGSTNDSYWYTNFNISYKIGKKDKRHKRWTYRGYDFNIFGAKKKYPLEDEVKQFEDDLNNYAANRPVKTDSVIIVHNLKKIYGPAYVYSVFFSTGGTNVDREDLVAIAEAAIQLMKNKNLKVEVIGFSDDTGPADKNMEISRKRAEAVKDILVNDLGISAERITVTAKGETELLSPTDKLSPRGIDMVNRRVDIVLRK
ncbi:MAG: OmpA family protein [Chlorobi bacterium]|nr:OmpA family protein [Chlorobiota bacterium]